MTSKLNALITRPKQQGLQLQQALLAADIASICQPTFEYQANTTEHSVKELVETTAFKIVIFVSAAAVEYADLAYPLNLWLKPDQTIIAVGSKTQAQLQQLGFSAVIPKTHTSEGMLALAELSTSQVSAQPILIIRGNGGREYLAEQLTARNAQVMYLESYRRNWLEIDQEQHNLWKNQQINAIVITSDAILNHLVNYLSPLDQYWQTQCLWCVASERIAKHALTLGLKHVVNCGGANDQTIVAKLKHMETIK